MGCTIGRQNDNPLQLNMKKIRNSTFKVVLIGDKAVGKSSIVVRYTQNKFIQGYALTIGGAFVAKKVALKNPNEGFVNLQIWDTAGEERYRSMTRFFYRNANLGIVVYDVTSEKSFKSVEPWIHEFREECPEADIILVGNKIDKNNRIVQVEHKYTKSDFTCLEVSAKTSENISVLFDVVAQILHNRDNQNSSSDTESTGSSSESIDRK